MSGDFATTIEIFPTAFEITPATFGLHINGWPPQDYTHGVTFSP